MENMQEEDEGGFENFMEDIDFLDHIQDEGIGGLEVDTDFMENQDGYDEGLENFMEDVTGRVLGSRIAQRHPQDLHFFTGCSGFDPTGRHKAIFMELARRHFMSKGAAFLNDKCRVRGEVAELVRLSKAKAIEVMGSNASVFRFWRAPDLRLNQSNWQSATFEDISENLGDLKKFLEAPLRKAFEEAGRHFQEQQGTEEA